MARQKRVLYRRIRETAGVLILLAATVFKLTRARQSLVSLNRFLGSMESDLLQIIRDRPLPWIKHPTEWWRQSLTEISNEKPLVELKFHFVDGLRPDGNGMVNLPNLLVPTKHFCSYRRNDRQMALQVAYQTPWAVRSGPLFVCCLGFVLGRSVDRMLWLIRNPIWPT